MYNRTAAEGTFDEPAGRVVGPCGPFGAEAGGPPVRSILGGVTLVAGLFALFTRQPPVIPLSSVV